MRNPIYFCDICNKERLDNEGNIVYDYFECYQKQGFIKHLKTPKHIKMCKEVEQDPKSVTCRYCNKKFSEKGYEIHKKRNQPLWDMKKIGMSVATGMKCNNFTVGKKRYESIDAYKETMLSKDGPPQKRCKVGEVSQITGIKREPQTRNNNKPKQNIQMAITKVKEDLTPEEKEVEERTEKIKEKEESNSKGYCEYESKREYNLTDHDWNLIDTFGEQLVNQLEEICETCEKPINDIEGSISLFKYHLKIKICDCEDD